MSRVLKYQSVKQRLLQYINEHGMAIGTRLPSDRALCARFGVSNLTLRHAADELCDSGLLRREEGKGVFVASSWSGVRQRLGYLSVDVPTYPAGGSIRKMEDMLDTHRCDLQILHARRTVQPWVVDAMSRMDYLVVSGFLTPEWVSAIRSLGKPVLQVGRTNLETGFPCVEPDYRDAFHQSLSACLRHGLKRFLVWQIRHELHSNSNALSQALEEAMRSCGLTSQEVTVDEISPDSMQSCVDSLLRNQGKFDAIVLRDYMLNYLVYHEEWRRLTEYRPLMVITCDMQHIVEYDHLPGLHILNLQQSTASVICQFFFRWQYRLPGDGRRFLEAWEFARPPFEGAF
ncbi:MAG: GntR family transcriptional regulator [Victivallales bacterium]|nr:GntR family transcriptional regulator [Victivallales bacterium]